MDQAGEMARPVRTVAVDYGPPRRPPPPTCDPGAGKIESPPGALGPAAVQSDIVGLERMGTIDTEEAARRLARVILSDIDLYIRERPNAGESLEAQIEEGRRLFVSRVTPELVPVFETVLADRAAGTVDAPASPAPTPANDDELPTDPSKGQ